MQKYFFLLELSWISCVDSWPVTWRKARQARPQTIESLSQWTQLILLIVENSNQDTPLSRWIRHLWVQSDIFPWLGNLDFEWRNFQVKFINYRFHCLICNRRASRHTSQSRDNSRSSHWGNQSKIHRIQTCMTRRRQYICNWWLCLLNLVVKHDLHPQFIDNDRRGRLYQELSCSPFF